MTDTFSLRLLYGLPAAVGDPLSAEQGMEIIGLVSEKPAPVGFFADDTRPFFAQIAGLKNGGTWLDNPAEDGRHLQSEAKGSVVETIYVKLAGDTTQRYHYLDQLARFADESRRFHSTSYQTRPVQIEWWATGAPGPQYALVYTIDHAISRSMYDTANVFDVVITLEREPAWRGVPFGMPATVWTQYALGHQAGSDYTYADLSLVTGTALVQETIQNKHEFDAANGYTANIASLSKNWIDIDAAEIPGNAPALVTIAATYADIHRSGASAGDWTIRQLFVARSTKPRSLQPRQGGQDRPHFLTLNAGDAQVNGNCSKVSSANLYEALYSNGSSVTAYYVRQLAAATLGILTWGGTTSSDGKYGLSLESLRGRFAAFIRGRTDTTSPATVELRLSESETNSPADYILIPSYLLPSTNASATEGLSMYIGSFGLPLNRKSNISTDGYGLDVQDMDRLNSDVKLLKLHVTPATATQTTYIFDLVLMPYDEGQIQLLITRHNYASNNINDGTLLYDNTGYLNREGGGHARIVDIAYELRDPELLGSEITLLPKVDNRLYFMFTRTTSPNANYAALEKELVIRVNIIPRWYGVRDA